MRFLITGGNGQLGREWQDFLQNQQADFETLSSGDLDISDKAAVEKKLRSFQPDVLINCAAYTKVDQAEEERDKAMDINGTAVEELAQICSSLKIKLVHYSTDYIFAGKTEDREILPDGYPEDHPPAPENVYGESKLKGEEGMQKSGCEYLLIRVSWLCGRYGNNFVKTMLRLSKNHDELKVVNDQFGCPTFTENVVLNTFELLKLGEEGIFHISSAGEITWYDFAKEIFRQRDIPIKVNPVNSNEFPARARRPAYSLLDTQKIDNLPGISIIDWKTGLEKLLNQLNEN